MKSRDGFTLAEVLITLGIIGVVAAMTLPVLIQNHKKTEASSRLKKFYSSISQAVVLSEAENGDISGWNKQPEQKDEEGNKDSDANAQLSKEFFMTYIAPYLQYTTISENKPIFDMTGKQRALLPVVYLPDGSSFMMNNGVCLDFWFDINGDSKPNVGGRDIFAFLFCPGADNMRITYCGNAKKGFCVPKWSRESREELKAECENDSLHCSGLLEYDNWKFMSDYPYKL